MIGFLADTAEADAYYATRLGAPTYWHSGTQKEAALTTAYNQLTAAGRWELPLPGSPEVTQDHKNAQMEQALFLLQMGTGGEMRMNLQAQGVIEAGIVKEKYKGDGGIPFSPLASSYLWNDRIRKPIFVIDLQRKDCPRR